MRYILLVAAVLVLGACSWTFDAEKVKAVGKSVESEKIDVVPDAIDVSARQDGLVVRAVYV